MSFVLVMFEPKIINLFIFVCCFPRSQVFGPFTLTSPHIKCKSIDWVFAFRNCVVTFVLNNGDIISLLFPMKATLTDKGFICLKQAICFPLQAFFLFFFFFRIHLDSSYTWKYHFTSLPLIRNISHRYIHTYACRIFFPWLTPIPAAFANRLTLAYLFYLLIV